MKLQVASVAVAILGGVSFLLPWLSVASISISGESLVRRTGWSVSWHSWNPVGPAQIAVLAALILVVSVLVLVSRGSAGVAALQLLGSLALLACLVDWLTKSGLSNYLAIGFWMLLLCAVGTAVLSILLMRTGRYRPARAVAWSPTSP